MKMLKIHRDAEALQGNPRREFLLSKLPAVIEGEYDWDEVEELYASVGIDFESADRLCPSIDHPGGEHSVLNQSLHQADDQLVIHSRDSELAAAIAAARKAIAEVSRLTAR